MVYRNNWADLYFENNIFDNAPYPIFNLALQSDGNGVGLYTENARVSLPAVTAAENLPESSYTNTLLEQFTDPEIFFADGRYYLYGTQSSTQNSGVKCYSTTNFSTFRDESFALRAGDAFGDGVFKAANVVYHDGLYYMFYMAKSNALGTSVTACASAQSPNGPFKNDEKTPLTNDSDFIGGQPFIDTDGTVYLIYTRTTAATASTALKSPFVTGKRKSTLPRKSFCWNRPNRGKMPKPRLWNAGISSATGTFIIYCIPAETTTRHTARATQSPNILSGLMKNTKKIRF